MKRCPATSCGAPDPPWRRLADGELALLPEDVRKVGGSFGFECCSYCGAVWVEATREQVGWLDAPMMPLGFVRKARQPFP
jgi:hypothetical protein